MMRRTVSDTCSWAAVTVAAATADLRTLIIIAVYAYAFVPVNAFGRPAYDSLMAAAHSIEPLTARTWDAFAALVERHNGIFGGCWCTYFHDCTGRGPGYEGSRAFKQLLVETGHAHAALVMVDEEAIAWAEYGTPDELPNIHHSKQYLAEADLLPDYRTTASSSTSDTRSTSTSMCGYFVPSTTRSMLL